MFRSWTNLCFESTFLCEGIISLNNLKNEHGFVVRVWPSGTERDLTWTNLTELSRLFTRICWPTERTFCPVPQLNIDLISFTTRRESLRRILWMCQNDWAFKIKMTHYFFFFSTAWLKLCPVADKILGIIIRLPCHLWKKKYRYAILLIEDMFLLGVLCVCVCLCTIRIEWLMKWIIKGL